MNLNKVNFQQKLSKIKMSMNCPPTRPATRTTTLSHYHQKSSSFITARSLVQLLCLADTQPDILLRFTQECYLRSSARCFTKFCNSHELSHFAVLFIELRAEVSNVKSCLKSVFFYSFFPSKFTCFTLSSSSHQLIYMFQPS
jgi:hypothetical protein